ncbi:MAG: VCBS repeat-containing protein [Candidatus Brockarchaeota archaeon]|nr:VCBS repeat-containing protein [Candidatus Brockarchaeota archaeon]
MVGSRMKFIHTVIDESPMGIYNSVCLVGDINGDGFEDVVVGDYVLDGSSEGTIVWYEYPEWRRHVISRANLEAGGVLIDVNGDGRLDIVAGQPYYGNELYWFENPEDPTQPWKRRVIESGFKKYHDQAAGDVDNDGECELLISSQLGRVLVYYDIPPDPDVSPWPSEFRHIVCEDISVEGLAIADLDCDGRNEVVAGPNVFKLDGSTMIWSRRTIRDRNGSTFSETRVQVADLNEDGFPDLIMSEGESDRGRLAWFEGPDFKIHVIRDDLFHPHSLGVADFDMDGHLDFFVGEMGLGRNPNPKLMIYLNDGTGSSSEFLVDSEHPTHEAKAIDVGNDGAMDIVGKPFHPPPRVDLWRNLGFEGDGRLQRSESNLLRQTR